MGYNLLLLAGSVAWVGRSHTTGKDNHLIVEVVDHIYKEFISVT